MQPRVSVLKCRLAAAMALLLVTACGEEDNPGLRADALPMDAGHTADGALLDGAPVDGALFDGQWPDGALVDGARPDGAPPDAAVDLDARVPDAQDPDAQDPDAQDPDAQEPDAQDPDAAVVVPSLPVVDGLTGDWDERDLLYEDPAGDATGLTDVTRIYARTAGTAVVLRFDLSQPASMRGGPEGDVGLKVRLGLPRSMGIIQIDPRYGQLELDRQDLDWRALRYALAPTHAGVHYELRLDLGPIGVQPGETLRLVLAGSDTLDVSSVPVVLSGSAEGQARRSAARAAGTTLRLVTLNVHEDGLSDATRAPGLRRLLGAVAADVYCLQEIYDFRPGQVGQLLHDLDPNGAWWNSQKSRDLVIASPHPLFVVPDNETRVFAVVVAPLRGEPLLVINHHATCCGSPGSEEDLARQAEAAAIAQLIADFKAGALGDALLPYRDAAVVLTGDFNQVGDRAPLDTMLGAGLTELMPRHLIGTDVWTWRSLDGNYAPGLLDRVLIDGRLRVRGSFALEEAELNDAERQGLGLEAGDFAATDHLPVVVDLSR